MRFIKTFSDNMYIYIIHLTIFTFQLLFKLFSFFENRFSPMKYILITVSPPTPFPPFPSRSTHFLSLIRKNGLLRDNHKM